MQLSNAMVRLGGSVQHVHPKQGITPAEILVLRAIHGDDAVTDIRPTKMDRTRSNDGEYQRLAGIYDRSAVDGAFGGNERSLMASLFPGALKKLPVTLKDIGVVGLDPPAKAAAQPEPEPEAEDEPAEDVFAPREDA